MPAQRPSIVCTGGIIAGLQGEHIHGLVVAGGLVMQHAPGGDWKRVDWDALAAWLDGYGYKVADCETEGPSDRRRGEAVTRVGTQGQKRIVAELVSQYSLVLDDGY